MSLKRKRGNVLKNVVTAPDDLPPKLSPICAPTVMRTRSMRFRDQLHSDEASGESIMPTLEIVQPMSSMSLEMDIQQDRTRANRQKGQSRAVMMSSVEHFSSGNGETSNEGNIACPGCAKSMTKASLLRHLKNSCAVARSERRKILTDDDEIARDLVCEYEDCAFIPDNMAEYWEHQIIHPPNGGFKCFNTKCNKVFIEHLNLLDHLRWHKIGMPFLLLRLCLIITYPLWL